ncbi:MAG: DUF5723 family protein [Mucinivorans sp.]
MKKIYKIYISALLVVVGSTNLCWSQSALRSSYFLDGMLTNHHFNPAIQGEYGYVGIPIIGSFNIGLNSNVGLANFLFPTNTGLTTFLSSSVSGADFLSALDSKNRIAADIQTSILAGGFWAWGGYNTVDVNFKSFTNANIPYEMFDFLKSGMSSAQGNTYKMENIMASTNNYIDIAFGHSRKIGDKWTVGVKVKFVLGMANVQANINRLDATLTGDKWLIDMQGQLDVSAPGAVFKTNDKGDVSSVDLMKKPFGEGLGYGAAIDFGATFKPSERFTISLAVIDLGFISWGKSYRASNHDQQFLFDGFSNIAVGPDGTGLPLDKQLTSLKDDLSNLIKFKPTDGAISNTRMLRTTINLGVEYNLVPEKFSFGLLATARFAEHHTVFQGLLSANYRPAKWFEMALSAGMSSNTSFSWGGVINFCPRFINFFVGADFVTMRLAPQMVPLHNTNMLISVGLNVPLARNREVRKNASTWTQWLPK